MAKTNRNGEPQSEAHRRWNRAPATGATFEGLLFCVVGLYMVATVGLPLFHGAMADADTQNHRVVAATLHHDVVASAGTAAGLPARATAD